MLRVAIITFLVSYCVALFSQPIYSRDFEARKKNVPLVIINNNENYFYLLRFNKAAHDITIERRAKPSAEIISFTPLKLDSLNANWFDYDKLDYLFFEHNYSTYFLFEKVLNSKKTIYLKISDTLGKSSGFIELASIEKEQGVSEIHFDFKRSGSKNILIVASQTYGKFAIKKLVLLFDVEKRKIIWAKKLPIENAVTGYSIAFECNETNDLFCVLAKTHIASFKRKNINQTQAIVPVFFYDSLTLASYLNNSPQAIKQKLAINNLSGINSIRIIPIRQEVSFIAHFSKQDRPEIVNTYFLNQKLSADFSKEFYAEITPLDDSIKESLTFYDGTDFKSASEKEYRHCFKFEQNNLDYQVSERVEDYFYKELFFWKNDLETGKISCQKIIPRKVYSFKERTRFKNIGVVMPVLNNDKLSVVILESPLNSKKDPNEFNYHRFKKETSLWKSNLVMYSINNCGVLEKKIIFHNANFDAVPMQYLSDNQEDFILYLNNGNKEKFAILKGNQL